jgi:hypothetical protein
LADVAYIQNPKGSFRGKEEVQSLFFIAMVVAPR